MLGVKADAPEWFLAANQTAHDVSLDVMEQIGSVPGISEQLAKRGFSFEPLTEIPLGRSRSNSEQWRVSLTRGAVITCRLMAYSYCVLYGLMPAGLDDPRFGQVFADMVGPGVLAASREWVTKVAGAELAKQIH